MLSLGTGPHQPELLGVAEVGARHERNPGATSASGVASLQRRPPHNRTLIVHVVLAPSLNHHGHDRDRANDRRRGRECGQRRDRGSDLPPVKQSAS